MSRTSGSLKLSSNLEIQAGAPIDARLIVPTYDDLTVAGNFPYSYVGMPVAVQATGKLYLLKAKPTTAAINWVEVGADPDLSNYYTKPEVNALIAAVYKPKGSVTFANLPVLSASVLGNVYNVTDAFTTTSDFVDGAGKSYPANTNVVVVNIGTEESPSYKFDVLAGFIDLSPYQLMMQYDTMPAELLTSTNVGKIVQYVGTTTSNFVSGYFYKVVESDTPGTYEWEAVDTQVRTPSALERQITATRGAGGVQIGDTLPVGMTFEEIFNAIFNPVIYPAFTAPSASMAATGSKLLEKGSTLSTTFTITFDRGSIKIDGVTQDYRSGAATSYSLDGSSSETNTFNKTITEDKLSYQGSVSYAEGPQPVDSIGRNYGSKLAAGSVNTNTITYEFVEALWANTSSISTIAKLALVSKNTKVKEFQFPAATISNPEVFDVPASWTVTAVEVWNNLASTWDDCSGEFAITDVNHDDAGSPATAIAYKRYTCSLGYDMAARKVRVKWS